MKFYKKSLIILFLLIITMGVVCAEDINDTAQDTLEIDDSPIVLTNSTSQTYDDLSELVDKSGDSITLESDYKYNQGTDKVKNIELYKKTLTIDGNNHAIDGDGKTIFLKIEKSDVTLKNMVLRNFNDASIIVIGSKLTTFNVTFENITGLDYGAAIYCSDDSTLTSTNDRFVETYAPNAGSAIFGSESKININNGTFENKNPINWSLIYGDGCEINVYETTFANINSKYATAIYNTYNTTIKKSKFINLHANATAGAVAIKSKNDQGLTYLTVIDSEFINVSAAKNGGAIFTDFNGNGLKTYEGLLSIVNSTFTQCSADFGGAILHLAKAVELINSTFTQNRANEAGGALYSSNAYVLFNATTFKENEVDTINGLGGAAYIDAGVMVIDKSSFENNAAGKGGGIYTFSTGHTIVNSTFANNGEDIHTSYEDNGSTITDCGELNSILDNRNSSITVRYNGEPIILNPQTIKGSASDSYFNLRDQGLVTSVKNQGFMGACWAFGAAGAFESAFLIATGKTIDISENNIQDLGLIYSPYGVATNLEGGNYLTSTSYFVSWLGAINTEDDSYDELGKISAVNYSPNAYRAVEAIFVNIKDKAAVKQALTKYGAMNLHVYGANSNDKSYNPKTYGVYNSKYGGNHYVTLVGWDDKYSKNNFATPAPGNGAWICKNSWGTDWGDGGYFYISYYDKSLAAPAVGFVFENVNYYEKLYQNELSGCYGFNAKYDTYGQVFTSEDGDLLAAVGTYFEKAKTPYTITIYVDDNECYSQEGVSKHAGYECIPLDSYIAVDENSNFEIRIQSSSVPMTKYSRMPTTEGKNYVIDIAGEFIDVAKDNLIAPVKAYTFKNPQISKNIVKYYSTNETIFTVNNVYETDFLPISFDDKNMTMTITNGSGSISLGVLESGANPVIITYKNQTFASIIYIKPTIDCEGTYEVTVAYNTKLTLENVKFLDSEGNPLENLTVTVKFDNKTVSDTVTGVNGSMPIIVTAGNKIGKHYVYYYNPVTTENATITVSIVSRFSGNSNVNMYYYDGHTYKVRLRDDHGKYVGKNVLVTIKIGKKSFKVKTNANGYAILKIPSTITPGKYTISVTYMKQTVKNTLTVKQVLKTAKTVKVKKSAKKLTLKATLKKGKTALKYKVVKFKVNGKTYKAKTNKKGIATLTLKKAVINKLKVKKYTVKVSYLNDVVKSTLQVRR